MTEHSFHYYISQRFLFVVLMRTIAENLDSHKNEETKSESERSATLATLGILANHMNQECLEFLSSEKSLAVASFCRSVNSSCSCSGTLMSNRIS